jgi:hypothetical protein
MGNTVGSRGVLTQRQREILVGTLLGDAHLEKNGRFTRLRVDHYEKHKEYIFWLAHEFAPFSLMPRQIVEKDKRNGKTYKRWHFSTKSLPIFDEFRDLFYQDGKKIIPSILGKLITTLSLAIWYMDDGFRRRDSKGFYLCTTSFTHEEQMCLQDVMLNMYHIQTSIHHQHEMERIFIPSRYADRFNNLIKPFILPVFHYKLL